MNSQTSGSTVVIDISNDLGGVIYNSNQATYFTTYIPNHVNLSSSPDFIRNKNPLVLEINKPVIHESNFFKKTIRIEKNSL